MVLLAIEPDEPETDYGYVVPHEDPGEFCRFGTRGISIFAEKPRTDLATKVVTAGGLWNTMVMVFKADTLLQLVRGIHPLIYRAFWRILKLLGLGRNGQRSRGSTKRYSR
jgi:mannose-1-phosphate guanylyltransferase